MQLTKTTSKPKRPTSKDARFEMRITQSQKDELIKLAKAANMDATQYILSVIFPAK
jgi:uncharacterized protein (DUF1778 family)